MNNGFVRVAGAIPMLRVADCAYNVSQIATMVAQAETEQVQVICFPELSITGYTCADLFLQQRLLDDAEQALDTLQMLSFSTSAVVIVGMPIKVNHQLFNTAVVLQGGKLLGVVPKTNLPNHNEFYEKRWFASPSNTDPHTIVLSGQSVPFGTNLLFSNSTFSFGIELCEDLWVPIPPSTYHAIQGAEIIFNLSATNELIGKHTYICQLIEQQSARCLSAYIYASAGSGESTTDLVYAGNAIIAENGKIMAKSERFSTTPQLILYDIDIAKLQADRIRNTNFKNNQSLQSYRIISIEQSLYTNYKLQRVIDKHPFVPPANKRDESCREIFSIQVAGLAKRWEHTQAQKLIVGVSGGLDSTLALLVCVKTALRLGFESERIVGVTMPGLGTTNRTYQNANSLMRSLGITIRDIPIQKACYQHFEDISHDKNTHDIVFENTQARERTQILMNLANQQNGLVVGTSDMSELALGWTTYNGDHMSMYGVNSGIPKTLVRYLIDWISEQLDNSSKLILQDILNTPISPELLPADSEGNIAQQTEHFVGPYELHDFYLYYFVRFGFSPSKILLLAQNAFADTYSAEEIKKWLKIFLNRFFSQQFKRSCMPDGPKVGSINLSPRGDWRMPSDAVPFEI